MAKYSKGAGKKVEKTMHEMHQGKLKSGRSGKKVTSRKQAIAIGLSEARERGEKVPKKSGSSSGRGTALKTASKKSASKSSASKSSASKRSASKKASSKSSTRSSSGASRKTG